MAAGSDKTEIAPRAVSLGNQITMTDFAAISDKQKRKRKLGSSAEKQTSEKKRNKNKVVDEAATVKLPVVKEAATNVEESQTWTNLNLILSLQNKNSTIQRLFTYFCFPHSAILEQLMFS